MYLIKLISKDGSSMMKRYLISTLSGLTLVMSIWSSADAVTFTPPSRNSAPSKATGGASRGSLFTPSAKNGTPRTATGGASRGNLFTNRGNGTPRTTTGGASRGNLFTNRGNGTPKTTTGGASRGNLFTNRGNGAPKTATGGASRVGSYELNPSMVGATGPGALIGLMPQSYYGTTISERPTVMVYIPASGAEEAVFSIKDEAGNMHYNMTIPVAEKTGVIGVKLPADAPALAVGKNYQWFLALKVNGELSPSTPYVDGWIERIQPNAELTMAMQQRDPLKLATAFGKNGVWYDCVATLAAVQAAQPNDANITKKWEELLTSVSLKEIVTAPLLAAN
jgi:hypothetical protein